MKKLDLTGQTFGRLTVISPAPNKGKKTAWLCKCSCGKEKVALTNDLTRGMTKSCGCIHHENLLARNTKHNSSHSRIYRIWANIKTRCTNPKTNCFKHYGGRGIRVCEEWENSYEAFRDWALANGYRDDLTIDRIDNNGNYEPSNCRWTTYKEQARNRRSTHLLTYNGTTLSVVEWSERLGIPFSAINSRVSRGWPVEKALLPLLRHCKN